MGKTGGLYAGGVGGLVGGTTGLGLTTEGEPGEGTGTGLGAPGEEGTGGEGTGAGL